jgi:hypothetical protein
VSRLIATWARQLVAALVFTGWAGAACAGNAVPTITLIPASPLPNESVTAVLPGRICGGTVVFSPGHVDINYALVPCAFDLQRDHIPLGTFAPGSYLVALNLVHTSGGSDLQASGTFNVAAAIAPLPATGPLAFLACVFGCIALAGIALRPARRRSRMGTMSPPE